MGYSKDQLLARLQELQIDFVRYDHPVVLTVEAQAKYVGHLGGGLSKNLFLKDKKQRFYIVTALAGTTVDLKVLSQRLGLGKGGLRMAPEEALLEILQVPLGCVTPFALINQSARDVSLLLDQGFKAQECCFFHPLSNDITISLTARDLDKFLYSVGKDPSYVDLEATPTVGKDQPPDLAALVPSSTTVMLDQPDKVAPVIPPASNATQVNKATANADGGKVIKKSNPVQSVKEKPKAAEHPSCAGADVRKLVDELINRTSKLVLSEITKETIQQHGEQLGAVVSDDLRKHLSSDFESLAMSFKNTAVTEGFHMGAQAGGYLRKCPS